MKNTARPWYNPPKKKKTVPSEQTEALQNTRKVSNYIQVIVNLSYYYYLIMLNPLLIIKLIIALVQRVAQAIASALGTAADIAHEALFIGVDLLDLAPVPGLKPAAQLLLNIWDASQLVDVSLMTVFILKHCANTLHR